MPLTRGLRIESFEAAPGQVIVLPIGVRQVLLWMAHAATRATAADVVLLVVEAARDDVDELDAHDLAGDLRLQLGLTQDALARQAGVGKRTIERYDQGKVKNPRIRQLLALGNVLDCTLDDIIEDDRRPQKRN